MKKIQVIQPLRNDFPILKQLVHGKRLAYLDNGATTQKPKAVLEALQQYYTELNANIHRGVHYLCECATTSFESARKTVAKFIHANSASECIFVRSTTEAINLIASTFGETYIHKDDEILISAMEHHSNIVPWQMLAKRKAAVLKIIPMNEQGELKLETLSSLITSKTKIISVTHISNALGTINPIKKIIDIAHAANVPVLIDGAQSAPHLPIDVQALDCDFYTFSGHKTYGPTGIGVLYAKMKWLEALPPYQGGGEMIEKVTFKESTWATPPHKFEAGTPPIGEAIAFAAALNYLMNIGMEKIEKHDQHLIDEATKILKSHPEIQIIGEAKQKAAVISFVVKGIHPHDIGTILDQEGIAIRTGHHCAMPVMDFFGVPATARISFGLYNSSEDLEQLEHGLARVKQVFKL